VALNKEFSCPEPAAKSRIVFHASDGKMRWRSFPSEHHALASLGVTRCDRDANNHSLPPLAEAVSDQYKRLVLALGG
jgi:hypothetical protein